MFLFTTPPSRDAAPPTPVVDAIRSGAQKTGTRFDYLLATAQRESALDPNARAKSSSASGLFQFVEQTWLGLIKSDGGQLGLGNYARAITTRGDGQHAVDDPATRQAILALRQDPAVASVMAGALTQRNREFLTAELGREPSASDLYAAHFLGARGAADLIRAAQTNPARPVATDFPDAAAANRPIFFDGAGRARGAGEVYTLLAQGHAGVSAAPAFAPDRPLTFAHADGPAFHGLFQTENRQGPISDAVARLWRTGKTVTAPAATAALGGFFPSSTGVSNPAREPEPAGTAAAMPASAPLPPQRPSQPPEPKAVRRPLDLGAFMTGGR
jgi:hypothetical protein